MGLGMGILGGYYVRNRDITVSLLSIIYSVMGGTDGHLLSKLWTNIDLLRGWERVFLVGERAYYVIELIGRWYIFYGERGCFLYGVGIFFNK